MPEDPLLDPLGFPALGFPFPLVSSSAQPVMQLPGGALGALSFHHSQGQTIAAGLR